MAKPRGTTHTTLTETAALVVRELRALSGIKMIAPGIINKGMRGGGQRYITVVYTKAGFELIITGQSVQKVAIHTQGDPREIIKNLMLRKKLRHFEWNEREKVPGI